MTAEIDKALKRMIQVGEARGYYRLARAYSKQACEYYRKSKRFLSLANAAELKGDKLIGTNKK